MCDDCVIGDLAGWYGDDPPDHYNPDTVRFPAVTPVMDRAVALIRAWYLLPPNGVGGVLHVATDDQNLDDSSLAFCRRAAHTSGEDPTLAAIADLILDALESMTEAERLVTVELADPYSGQYGRLYDERGLRGRIDGQPLLADVGRPDASP